MGSLRGTRRIAASDSRPKAERAIFDCTIRQTTGPRHGAAFSAQRSPAAQPRTTTVLARIEKAVEGAARRFFGNKARSAVVRKLSAASKDVGRKLFRQTRSLKRFSFGGALLGAGLIYLLATLYDRIRAIADRPYNFVSTNFEAAARGWKRRPEIQEPILARRIWPVYALALQARDLKPPYQDQESFLALARTALAADRTLLEGHDGDGTPARIPFRETQKLFSTAPFSLHRCSINDLRFSWYRDIRDRHLGWRRWLRDLNESRPFENYLLIGLRRDLLTWIGRGLKGSKSGVRIEDVVGTSDTACIDADSALDRERICAYVARKLMAPRRPPRDRVFFSLEDGVRNLVREISSADAELLTGTALCLEAGRYGTRPMELDLVADLEWLLENHGPIRRPDGHAIALGRLKARREEAKALTDQLVDFVNTNDAGHRFLRDLGDLRAVRVAIGLDKRLRKRFLARRHTHADELLGAFAAIAARQTDYDRALIELRGVYQAGMSDFDTYNEFLETAFLSYAGKHPDADFDPWYARFLPRQVAAVRSFLRRLRQRLQRL